MNIDLRIATVHRGRHGGRPLVVIDLGSGWKVPRQGAGKACAEYAGRIELVRFACSVLAMARCALLPSGANPAGTRPSAPMVESPPELECGRSHTTQLRYLCVSCRSHALYPQKKDSTSSQIAHSHAGHARPPTDGRPPKHTHDAAERTPIGRLP